MASTPSIAELRRLLAEAPACALCGTRVVTVQDPEGTAHYEAAVSTGDAFALLDVAEAAREWSRNGPSAQLRAALARLEERE